MRSLSGSKRLVKGRGFNDKSPRNIGHNSYSRLIRGTCENRRLSLFTASQKQKIKKASEILSARNTTKQTNAFEQCLAKVETKVQSTTDSQVLP